MYIGYGHGSTTRGMKYRPSARNIARFRDPFNRHPCARQHTPTGIRTCTTEEGGLRNTTSPRVGVKHLYIFMLVNGQ